MSERQGEPPYEPIRDLPDFHLRWPEFRPAALAAARAEVLTPKEREVIVWLTRLADRIGARDLTG